MCGWVGRGDGRQRGVAGGEGVRVAPEAGTRRIDPFADRCGHEEGGSPDECVPRVPMEDGPLLIQVRGAEQGRWTDACEPGVSRSTERCGGGCGEAAGEVCMEDVGSPEGLTARSGTARRLCSPESRLEPEPPSCRAITTGRRCRTRAPWPQAAAAHASRRPRSRSSRLRGRCRGQWSTVRVTCSRPSRHGRACTWGPTSFTQVLPAEASQLVDQVIAPRRSG